MSVGLLVAMELVAIAVFYQVLTDFECRATDVPGFCWMLRSLVARAIAVLAAMVVLWLARPAAFARLGGSASNGQRALAAGLHVGGIAFIFVPLLILGGADPSAAFSKAVMWWLAGAALAVFGVLLWIASPADWWRWLRQERFVPLFVLAAAALIPDIANVALPLWDLSLLTSFTFDAVQLVLDTAGAYVVADPATRVIVVDDFAVSIARQCSGVEGFALVSGFTGLYAFLFRRDIRWGRYWLIVLPVGLALSWTLNVVRISVLVAIGAYVSPDLAVNGFHSYSGWMFFTLLALGLLWAVQASPWLHVDRAGASAGDRLPLFSDPTAALIIPFIAFMVASVVASALAPHPDLGYPVKAAAMAAALAAFHRIYRTFRWSLDPLAIGAGILVGIGWLATQPPPGSQDAVLQTSLAELGGLAVAGWIVIRLVGTIVLVPFVEELFFRGYVLRQLDSGGLVARVVAITVSSALFALMHTRWLEAFCAGLVFALVALHRGRLPDAIIAHLTANALIALWAVMHGDWSAI